LHSPPGIGYNSFSSGSSQKRLIPSPHNLLPLCCQFIYVHFLLLKVLSKYYPEVAMSAPSIGRKGKALRRRNQRRSAETELHLKGSTCYTRQNFPAVVPAQSKAGIENPFSCLSSFQHLKMIEYTKN